jgi:hypothetical protein
MSEAEKEKQKHQPFEYDPDLTSEQISMTGGKSGGESVAPKVVVNSGMLLPIPETEDINRIWVEFMLAFLGNAALEEWRSKTLKQVAGSEVCGTLATSIVGLGVSKRHMADIMSACTGGFQAGLLVGVNLLLQPCPDCAGTGKAPSGYTCIPCCGLGAQKRWGVHA